MGLGVVTAAEIEPIKLSDLKDDLRVDADLTEHDFLIRGLLAAARRWVEETSRRALITQTLQYTLDGWPEGDTIKIPRPPLQSVDSIKYYGIDDAEYILSSSLYFVDTIGRPGRVVLNDGESWPSSSLRPANAVIVQFVAGYGDEESDIPENLIHAIRLLVAFWYEHPEAVATSGGVPKAVPFGVQALISPDRAW